MSNNNPPAPPSGSTASPQSNSVPSTPKGATNQPNNPPPGAKTAAAPQPPPAPPTPNVSNNNAVAKPANSAPSSQPNSQPTTPSAPRQQRDTDLSPEFQAIISKVVQQSDPLDDPNFNATDYINRMFPTESSLNGLEFFMQRLNLKISHLDDEILKTVREQSAESSKGTKNLEDAKKAIQELGEKIKNIKYQSQRSQTIVDEICADIRTLDRANHNLTNTVSVLRRLKLYTNSVDQLKTMASTKQYAAAGGFLEAVNQLDQHFCNYIHNPKIAKIHENVKLIRQTFTDQVYGEYTKFLENPQNPDPAFVTTLNEACIVIEALGKESKDKFIKWFCAKELADYDRFFKPGEESGKLDNTDRRYQWLMKLVKKFDELYQKVFPATWGVTEMLCYEFCVMTKGHLETVLRFVKSTNTLNPDLMVAALTRTVTAENGLIQRFGGSLNPSASLPPPPPDALEPIPDEEEVDADSSSEALNPHSAAAIKVRWKKHRLLKQQQQQQIYTAQVAASKIPADRDPARFKGLISSAFDPYMDLYIKKEDTDVNELLSKALAEETWTVDDEALASVKVLTSSTDLFYYYKESIGRLMKIFKPPALFDLYTVYKKYLHEYAMVLSSKLPTTYQPLSSKEEKALCLIINTADYCAANTAGLAATIKKQLPQDLAEKVDLMPEKEEYEAIIGKITKALVSCLISKLEPAFVQMTKVPWTTWSYVEDQSAYVGQVSDILWKSALKYSEWMANQTHYTFFCDTLCLVVLPVYKEFMFGKCKRVSEVGAQQLMLDLNSIKTLLSDLPKGGKELPVPARYLKNVKKETSKLENLLRVVLAPTQALVETYKALVQEPTEIEFTQILDFKGVSGRDRTTLLDSFKGQSNTGGGIKKINLFNLQNVLTARANPQNS